MVTKIKIKKISTKPAKIRSKPRAKIIPKLEIEKHRPRKLPATMPTGLSKKPKTVVKKKPSKSRSYPGNEWKTASGSKAAKKKPSKSRSYPGNEWKTASGSKAAKKKPSRKDEIRYPGSIWKIKSEAAKKGWISRRKNAKKK